MSKRILCVVTNAQKLHLIDGEDWPSGYWAEEFAVPIEAFREAGFEADIATIDGVKPTVDASSLSPDNIQWVVPEAKRAEVDFAEEVDRYRSIISSVKGLDRPVNLATMGREQVASYDALYIAGGHGCMTDMASSWQTGRLLLNALQEDMLIGSVCHGPTAFLSVRDAGGRNPLRGRNITCFSQAEETLTPIWGKLPMVIEYDLVAQGMNHSKAAEPWGSHVVRDGKLITGQNPYSSKALAEAMLDALKE